MRGKDLFVQVNQSIEAWDFCARVLNPLEGDEELPSYRRQVIDLLVCVLDVGHETPRKWGSRLEKMPEYHKRSLWWAWLVYSAALSQSQFGLDCYKFFKEQQNQVHAANSSDAAYPLIAS